MPDYGTIKSYSELGKLLDTLARRHDVRGPYSIAQRVVDISGHNVSGQAVSRYFYGTARPRPAFIRAFAQALELSLEERDCLAWLYAYGEPHQMNPQSSPIL